MKYKFKAGDVVKHKASGEKAIITDLFKYDFIIKGCGECYVISCNIDNIKEISIEKAHLIFKKVKQ